MNETVTIPKAEYDRLRALEEELADVQAALVVEARIASGQEELIPPAWWIVSSTVNRPCGFGANSAI